MLDGLLVNPLNRETGAIVSRRSLAREVASLIVRVPSHAVLLPPREDERPELTDTEREASSSIRRLNDWRAHGNRAGKGVASKEYRLFFLCGTITAWRSAGSRARATGSNARGRG